MSEKPANWENDFIEFLSAEKAVPPVHVAEQISCQVSFLLNPSPWSVFSKLSIVVFAVSIVNLAICPQFGLRYFHNEGLSQFFMGAGPLVCHAICGSFFIGSAVLVAAAVMRPEDLRVLRKTRFLQISALSAFALSGFIALGAEVFLPIALTWLLGGIVVGILTVEIAYWIRIGLWQHQPSAA